MKKSLLIAAPLLAGALVAGAAVPAIAADIQNASATSPASGDSSSGSTPKGASLSDIQAKGTSDTGKRIDSLTEEIARITAAKGISDADRTTVLATLNADLSAMKSLQAKIAGDTTAEQARADVKSIFTEYRVYAVAIPQSNLAAFADRATSTTIPKLQADAGKLASRVSGNADLQAKLSDLNAQLTTAQNDVSGLAQAALAVHPSDYNGNHSVVTALRDKAKAAHAALKQAQADRKAIVQALKK